MANIEPWGDEARYIVGFTVTPGCGRQPAVEPVRCEPLVRMYTRWPEACCGKRVRVEGATSTFSGNFFDFGLITASDCELE